MTAPDDAKGIRILVVDDEEAVRTFLKEALEERGYRVELAQSAGEAAQKLPSGGFGAVILDYMMPNGDGKFVYDLIRSMAPQLSRRVLLVTGAPHHARLIRFLSKENIPFLRKPFTIDALMAALDSLAPGLT